MKAVLKGVLSAVMNDKDICSHFFSLICLSGFIFQVYQVCDLYFRFQTTSKTEFEFREIEDYPTIMYCPRFTDLLNRTNYKEYGIGSTPIKNLDELDHELNTLSIQNISELTPNESDTMQGCQVRDENISGPLFRNAKECNKFFMVTKSVNGEKVCYTFMPRVRRNYSVGDVASSRLYAGVIYQVFLRPSLAQSVIGYFITYFEDSAFNRDPLNSRLYQARVVNTATFNRSTFAIIGETVTIKRLPPPFDTKCVEGHQRGACYEVCLIDKFSVIKKIPWSGFHRDKIVMKMPTSKDFDNENTRRLIFNSFQECHGLCKLKSECETSFGRTTVQEFEDRTLVENFVLMAMIPAGPHLNLYAVPFLNLIEFVVQVGSCFGVWFGLAIISFNPIKCKMFRKKTSTSKVLDIRPRRIFFLSKSGGHYRTRRVANDEK